MDFRSLRYFLAVADVLSFSKASGILHVAQPALSRQVRKLEDELRVELFVRTGTGVELTQSGELLRARARTLMQQIANMAEEVRAESEVVRGKVTVGVTPATGELLVPLLAKRCREDFPQIELRIVEAYAGLIYGGLVKDEIQLGLIHSPAAHRSIRIEPVLVEPMYLIGPPQQSTGCPPASPEIAIDSVPLIMPRRGHSLRELLEAAMDQEGRELDIAFEVDGLVSTRALVASGLGYTVLAYGAVHDQLMSGKLTAVPLSDPEILWRLCLVSTNEIQHSRTVTVVRNIIRSEIHKLVDAGMWQGSVNYADEEIQLPADLSDSR
ncbi:LysR family transcriptional regulator [Pelagibacterium lacus]|nr:LysR family transcriptional regulator [Pelagibacterium lacus]